VVHGVGHFLFRMRVRYAGLFCGETELFCGYEGLVCGEIGLFCGAHERSQQCSIAIYIHIYIYIYIYM